jgi:N utilization substance protein A
MVVNELNGEKIDIVPFTDVPEDLVAKALAPAKVKEVRLDYDTGTATVIVPDFQLSLAIGKEGQNARLAARLSGWRVDIKSETQLAEEEAYANQDWAEGEWITDTATGEQLWQPADGSDALSALAWAAATEQNEADAATTDASPTSDADAAPAADRTPATDAAPAPEFADDDAAISVDPESSGDESAVTTEAVAADEVAGAAEPTPAGVDAASGATPEAEIAAGAMPEDQ